MRKITLIIILFVFLATLAFAGEVRVFYKPNGEVVIIHLIEKARKPGETDEEMFNRCAAKVPALKDLEYEDMDISQLPVRDENRDKWRGTKGKGVWIDHSVVTKREKFEQLCEQLDTELAKSEPDVVKVIKLKRQIEKLREIEP